MKSFFENPTQTFGSEITESSIRSAQAQIVKHTLPQLLKGGFLVALLLLLVSSILMLLNLALNPLSAWLMMLFFSVATGFLWPFAMARDQSDRLIKIYKGHRTESCLTETHLVSRDPITEICVAYPFDRITIVKETPDIFVLNCQGQHIFVQKQGLQATNLEEVFRNRIQPKI